MSEIEIIQVFGYKSDMRILAIETSCDDTGIAILEIRGTKKAPSFIVLSNIVSSQIEVHKKYGGVYPMMAKREHQRSLLPTLLGALRESKLLNPKSETRNSKQIRKNPTGSKQTKFEILNSILEREPELLKKIIPFLGKYEKPDIDLIAVTNGPGLEPCLWVGVNFAKCLSYFWDIPIVATNHIESHILVNFLNYIRAPVHPRTDVRENFVKFPAIALVVSGGHTQLILMNDIGKYKILGETRDDAAGECFDKCAKILGLGYPGGPAIAALAAKSEALNPKSEIQNSKLAVTLPRPMINSKDCDFSFSGLKTAVLYAWQKQRFFVSRQKTYYLKAAFAKEIQQAIIDVLIKKTIKAAKDYKVKTIILGGGVSANQELRKQFKKKIEKTVVGNFAGAKFPTTVANKKIEFLVPEPELSTDNGLMIAVAGYFNKKNTVDWKNISANGNLRIGK